MDKLAKFCVLLEITLCSASPLWANVADRYETLDISIPGITGVYVQGINNAGIIYGTAYKSETGAGGVFRYNANNRTAEFTDQISIAGDMNNSGVIAGQYYLRNGEIQYSVWNTDGSITDLPVTHYMSAGRPLIDDSGNVVEQVYDRTWSQASFTWNKATGTTQVFCPTDSTDWNIVDINNAGYYLARTSGDQYIIWNKDGVLKTFTDKYTGVYFINDLCQAAGITDFTAYEDTAFLWDADTGMTTIDAGPNNTFYVDALNNCGQMLLDYYYWSSNCGRLSYNHDLCIWDQDTGLINLADRIGLEDGWEIEYLSGLNDNAWITASIRNKGTDEFRNVILRPLTTPEPGSIVAMLVGIIGLVGFASKRK